MLKQSKKLVIAVLFFFLAIMSFELPSYAKETAKTIRVGYYENEVFEEGAQEGSQVRATHLTLLGTPTLWTFTPGDLTPSALSPPPWDPKASASSPTPRGT